MPVLRDKGDRYRPVVTVAKAKKGVPTVVEISGQRYTLTHPDHKRGAQEIKRRAK
ncbi:hypothetical protein FLK61_34205 [Paenalkalicoccus suaedae]|uniref:Uncharacterized protein n=1 Tax=Paenalkalicoccus suaedae TaxID=2592382 RepID=A0A859FES9_9BACI|nr:hypothetical protein [Paenalkalicoccus suaedae]QKS71679.1 hypothetical protein FLK61_33910 [Paenalkalicoccus suaedae]QKS71732.1 hypothetical protein FLK61_34205 [Paenalkalicoccus suaedae]